jgi:hypothetical protein
MVQAIVDVYDAHYNRHTGKGLVEDLCDEFDHMGSRDVHRRQPRRPRGRAGHAHHLHDDPRRTGHAFPQRALSLLPVVSAQRSPTPRAGA